MNQQARFLAGFLTAAMMLAGMFSSPTPAQENSRARKVAAGKPAGAPTRVIYENDKVRVQEVTFRPDDQGPNAPRPFRIIRVLEGGTMQRTYPDGRIDKVEYRAGEVKVFEADRPFVPKNVGQSTIVLYVVALKAPKK